MQTPITPLRLTKTTRQQLEAIADERRLSMAEVVSALIDAAYLRPDLRPRYGSRRYRNGGQRWQRDADRQQLRRITADADADQADADQADADP